MKWVACDNTDENRGKTAVLKFGGRLLTDNGHIRRVAEVIRRYLDKGYRLSVIISSMGDTTDRLIEMANDVSDDFDGREMDQLLATGGQQSVALLALALKREGISAQSFTAAQAGFRANGFPMEGRIYRVDPSSVTAAMDAGMVAVVAGFQAITGDGDVITLGRGGTDLSAVALAAALGGECHIFKEAGGILSADPDVVRSASRLDYLEYSECMELSILGAKVLKARSVEVAARYEAPIYVASGFTEEGGTWIVKNNPVSEGLVVKGVVLDSGVAKVVMMGVPDVPGVAGRLFSNLAERSIGPEMIIQNNMRGGLNDIGFLVKKESLDDTIEVCRDFARNIDAQGVSFNTEISRVSIVGAGIANHPEVPSRMFNVLAGEGINIDMIAATALAVTCVVASPRAEDAVRALHAHFIEEGEI
ncbi:MAG: aspartate kinase [Synergistaceae bacterium]|nr:aspartate kinase [Synergistaceae bacterium]